MNSFERHAHSEPTYQEFLERDEAHARSAERREQAIENGGEAERRRRAREVGLCTLHDWQPLYRTPGPADENLESYQVCAGCGRLGWKRQSGAIALLNLGAEASRQRRRHADQLNREVA